MKLHLHKFFSFIQVQSTSISVEHNVVVEGLFPRLPSFKTEFETDPHLSPIQSSSLDRHSCLLINAFDVTFEMHGCSIVDNRPKQEAAVLRSPSIF